MRSKGRLRQGELCLPGSRLTPKLVGAHYLILQMCSKKSQAPHSRLELPYITPGSLKWRARRHFKLHSLTAPGALHNSDPT